MLKFDKVRCGFYRVIDDSDDASFRYLGCCVRIPHPSTLSRQWVFLPVKSLAVKLPYSGFPFGGTRRASVFNFIRGCGQARRMSASVKYPGKDFYRQRVRLEGVL